MRQSLLLALVILSMTASASATESCNSASKRLARLELARERVERAIAKLQPVKDTSGSAAMNLLSSVSPGEMPEVDEFLRKVKAVRDRMLRQTTRSLVRIDMKIAKLQEKCSL